MRLLPYRRFVLETPLAPAEVLRRLEAAVEAPRWERGRVARPTMRRPFVGAVRGPAFDVQRATPQRRADGFRPVVAGRVEAAGSGTRVTGRMRLRHSGAAFLALWVAGLLYGATQLARPALAAGRLDPRVLFPLGMIAAAVTITMSGFVPETRRALDALAAVVGATRAELR